MNLQKAHLLRSSWIFVLISILTLLWFGSLNYRHLIPSDEGRYAEIAREMAVTGDWITPRYNDYKYFEKPPLQAWASAIIFKTFGLGNWQARLWSGLTSFLSILAIGFTAGRLYGRRTGWLASIILASSPIWVLGGHFNSLDMGLSGFLCFALCALLLAQNATENSTSETWWMLCCWSAMGLSVLSKGLVGIVLPGLVLLIYALTARDFKIWRRLHWFKGLSLFLLITAPWFILISIKNPEFPHFFFIKEHFERFTTDEHRRVAPWFFFFPLLIVGFLPWLLQLPKGIIESWKERRDSTQTFKPLWLCLVWAVFIFAFFSQSHSKLPGYIIPIFPALAIIAAVALEKSCSNHDISRLWQFQTGGWGILFFAGFAALPQIAKTGEVYEAALYAQYAYWIFAALSVAGIACFLAFLLRHKSKLASVLVYALGFLLMALIAGMGHESVGRLLSGFDLATQVKPFVKADAPFYSVNTLDHTVPFYLEKSMTMVAFPDELAFGIEQEPQKWLPTIAEFTRRWKSREEPDALALMTPQTYASFKAENLPMQLIAQDPLRVVVKKLPLSVPKE